MEKKRITKKECLWALAELTEVKENADLSAFVKNELELLERKKSSPSKKRAAHQEENERYALLIYDTMLEEPDRLFTLSEIKDFRYLPSDEFSGQRITYLLTKLVNERKIERLKEKKKTLYKVTNL